MRDPLNFNFEGWVHTMPLMFGNSHIMARQAFKVYDAAAALGIGYLNAAGLRRQCRNCLHAWNSTPGAFVDIPKLEQPQMQRSSPTGPIRCKMKPGPPKHKTDCTGLLPRGPWDLVTTCTCIWAYKITCSWGRACKASWENYEWVVNPAAGSYEAPCSNPENQ